MTVVSAVENFVNIIFTMTVVAEVDTNGAIAWARTAPALCILIIPFIIPIYSLAYPW